MMRKMKVTKYIAGVIILSAFAVSLAGCSSEDKTQSLQTQSTQKRPEPEDAKPLFSRYFEEAKEIISTTNNQTNDKEKEAVIEQLETFSQRIVEIEAPASEKELKKNLISYLDYSISILNDDSSKTKQEKDTFAALKEYLEKELE